MQHYYDLAKIQLENSLVTIGSFDGVHIGHQQIIHGLVEGARQTGLPGVVVTFHPHPQLVLKGSTNSYYLTLPEKRAELLGDLGVDLVLTYSFTRETSQKTAEDFVLELRSHLNFSELWVGYDFALGKDRQGTASRLRKIGQENSFHVREIPAFYLEGELVSSSRVRDMLRNGFVSQAADLLGRPFELSGKVIRGENRGKSLGFPTSNLEIPPEMVDIKPGVYACLVRSGEKVWQAVTNIGYRPTFEDQLDSPSVETHILDFSGNLYGEELTLVFIERLRDEKKFNQVSDLIDQVGKDIARARKIFIA
jgi:riboflavin kinase/FMN adenylyltransferase